MPMRSTVILILILLACADLDAQEISNAARKLREDTERTAQMRREGGWRLVRGDWKKPSGTFAWSDMLRLQDGGPEMKVVIDISERLRPNVDGSRTTLIEIEGSQAVWQIVIERRALATGESPIALLLARAFDLPPDAPFQLDVVTIQNGTMLLRATGLLDQSPAHVEFRHLPDQRAIIILRRTIEPGVDQSSSFSAESLQKLYAEHPDEVATYLVPLFKTVFRENPLAPGAADVYRAFEQIPADPEVANKLEEIVARLGSPDPQVRENATIELRNLGRPGVLAALRMSRDALDHEQQARLSNFIESHNRGYVTDVESARADKPFLQLSLDDPDPHVRDAARKLLEMAE